MKRYKTWTIAAALLLPSCAKKATTQSDPCKNVMCTALFAMINVTIEDSAGNPITLDSNYTLRLSNGEKIHPAQQNISSNVYTILDDSYQKNLVNNKDSFYFIGFKNSKKVVDEPYTLSADCCHISKQSGKEKVVLP